MRTALVIGALLVLAASDCGAVSFTLGNASGSPGERVSLAVGASPAGLYTGFEFQIDYDADVLSYSGFSLSGDARGNGIDDIDTNIVFPGRVRIEATASSAAAASSISSLGSIRFTISSGAGVGSADVGYSGGGRIRFGSSSWATAIASDSATVSITAPPTPTPSGPPPVLTLSMTSPPVIIYGQEPILHFLLELRDPSWLGSPSDAYIAVTDPLGRLFYLDRHGRFTPRRSSVQPGLIIEEMDGGIGFGPAPTTLPAGRYTFYGVLTYVELDPTKTKSRITNLDSTHFDLLAPTPAPTPLPGP